MSSPQPPRAWYALRRTLPTWSFEDNLQELVQVLPRYRVNEVIVKVDTEEFSHGQPPLDWVREYQPRLFRIKEAMERIGVRYSVNPWITVGHTDRGRHADRQLPGLRTTVGHDGARSTACACPLSSVWRENTRALWTLYAQTHPHVIWVEDDIRTFNHGPVRYGCFCEEHMDRFSRRVGRTVSREELVAALLAPGPPHPWRAVFLDLQAEIILDTVRFLARTVHEIAPDTSLGLMSSGPRNHALEGRRWRELAGALADGKTLYSRPPMGNYSESSLRGFYYSHDSIKITRHCLPAGVVEQTEVENVPFTRYSKSVAFTFVEMAVSFAYGSHGVTMNLYDHCGTPMEDEPGYGRMLAQRKPFLEGLARRAQQPGRFAGVHLLFDPRESYHKHLTPGAPYGTLSADGAATMHMLEAHGLPTTYDESPVTATSGQQLRALDDDQIRDLLHGGLLLDGVAAGVLHERGFGDQIGLRSIQAPRCIDELGAYSAEEHFHPDFDGRDHMYLTLTLPGLGGRPSLALMDPMPGVQILSRMVDPDAQPHHPTMYAFENEGGGRVIVHLFDLDTAYGVAFNHPHRARQLQAAVRWLGRGRVPLCVRGGVYPLALRREMDGTTLLGLFDLTLDPWPWVEFELADGRRIQRMERLTAEGAWQEDERLSAQSVPGGWRVRFQGEVPYDEPLMVTVYWS